MNEAKNLSFEEKIKLLDEKDIIYLDGYIDRAIKELIKRKSTKKQYEQQKQLA